MSAIFRIFVATVASLIVTSPLLYEPWFTWRVWLVAGLLIGVRYWLYCVAQDNLKTVAIALINGIKTLIEDIPYKTQN